VGLAFDGDSTGQPTVLVSNPTPVSVGKNPQPVKPAKKRFLGMTFLQIVMLVFIALVEFCVLLGFGALVYFTR